jgi:hypothetical protein
MYISSCANLPAGCATPVGIDQWDIANAGNYLSGLVAAPSNGTVVEGLPSGSYWEFELGGLISTSPSSLAVAVDDASLSSFSVDTAPAFINGPSADFIVEDSGAFKVSASAFPAATFSESGPLPTGVAFVDEGNGTATLSGTAAPGTAGTYPISITASNGVAPDAIQAFTLTVLPIGVTTTSLPGGSVYSKINKASYSATLSASGGNPPYKWSLVSGSSLPPGLKLSSKGVVSGKAKTAGTYAFTVQVVDTKTKAKPPTQNKVTARLSITIS